MRLQAKAFSKPFIAARAEVQMTPVGAHDAKIAAGQCLETGIAMPLCKTLIGFASAMLTNDCAQITQADTLPNQRIHRLFCPTEIEVIFNPVAGSAGHF